MCVCWCVPTLDARVHFVHVLDVPETQSVLVADDVLVLHVAGFDGDAAVDGECLAGGNTLVAIVCLYYLH